MLLSLWLKNTNNLTVRLPSKYIGWKICFSLSFLKIMHVSRIYFLKYPNCTKYSHKDLFKLPLLSHHLNKINISANFKIKI